MLVYLLELVLVDDELACLYVHVGLQDFYFFVLVKIILDDTRINLQGQGLDVLLQFNFLHEKKFEKSVKSKAQGSHLMHKPKALHVMHDDVQD